MYGIKPSRLVEAIFLLLLASPWPVPGEPGATPDGEDRLAAARGHLAAGCLDDAERLYRELIAADPQQVAQYQGLAEVYVARGRPDAAVELILQVARKLIPSRRFGEALATLERAAALAPNLAEVHVLLGRSLAEERRYSSAAEAYERALELGESDLETLLYTAAANRAGLHFRHQPGVSERRHLPETMGCRSRLARLRWRRLVGPLPGAVGPLPARR